MNAPSAVFSYCPALCDALSRPPRLVDMAILEALVPPYPGGFHPKGVALVLLLLGSCLWLGRAAFQKIARYSQPSTPDLEKPASPLAAKTKIDRKPGEWIPSDFKRPRASPYPNWDVRTTKPLPYRPFRYGPKYSVTMGLRKMKWDEWIELDNHYPRYHADKARRIKERGEKCCKTAPEAMDGAIELLEELCVLSLVSPTGSSVHADNWPIAAPTSRSDTRPCSRRPTSASTTSSPGRASTSCNVPCLKTPWPCRPASCRTTWPS
ncbi:hypothetical protein VTN02DRAFT_4861 [Thermoascus thermophilus]